MAASSYDKNVFINCPFDADYRPLFEAIVFVVRDCGFHPRSAREVIDSGEVRIEKIRRLIHDSRFGIHDISRTELTKGPRLPRFNMPLELGLFMGAKAYGDKQQQRKVMLVFERQPYSYQRYCSDIAGQDVVAHRGLCIRVLMAVRDWLCSHSKKWPMPSGTVIATRFGQFRRQLPLLCDRFSLDARRLTFTDYKEAVVNWIEAESDGA